MTSIFSFLLILLRLLFFLLQIPEFLNSDSHLWLVFNFWSIYKLIFYCFGFILICFKLEEVWHFIFTLPSWGRVYFTIFFFFFVSYKKKICWTKRCNDIAATCPQVWPIVRKTVNICKIALHVLPICGYPYIHSWTCSKCYFSTTHRRKKVTFPQMWTAQMGCVPVPPVHLCSTEVSYCTKVTRQYGSLQRLSGLRHSNHQQP